MTNKVNDLCVHGWMTKCPAGAARVLAISVGPLYRSLKQHSRVILRILNTLLLFCVFEETLLRSRWSGKMSFPL